MLNFFVKFNILSYLTFVSLTVDDRKNESRQYISFYNHVYPVLYVEIRDLTTKLSFDVLRIPDS